MYHTAVQVVFRRSDIHPVLPHVVISLVLKTYVQVQKPVVGTSTRFRPLSVPP